MMDINEYGPGLFILALPVGMLLLIGIIGESGDTPSYRKRWPGLLCIIWDEFRNKLKGGR